MPKSVTKIASVSPRGGRDRSFSSALLFQKKKWFKKTSHTLFWMSMMRMKSLTLTLNVDHKVSNFSISVSAVLLKSSFYGIP